jgi:hypothetical protein
MEGPDTLRQQEVELLGFSSEEEVWNCWADLPASDRDNGESFVEEDEPERLYELVAHIAYSAMEKTLFHTNSGLIGAGPPLLEPGDLVYLIHGSDLPVLLRKVDGKIRNVGICYVHGISG